MDVIPGANRTTGQIYTEMISGNELHRLRDFGYTFIVVDWHNSRKDIRLNAINLMGLIEYLKCEQANGDVNSDEQFVILGESMGGLVARYCLTYMETHPTHCISKKMHNTRLLITLDSPHRGANVPLSLQHMYRFLGGGIMGEFNTITQKIAGKSWNLFLDATAAQQMLIYHVDTYIPTAPYSPYGAHPAKAWFDADLLLQGNYPKYCKMMAMSNGSIASLGQTSIWNTGVERTPNDRLMYINSDMNIRVLGRSFKIAGTLMDLKTNPNGTGNIATIEHGTWFVKIKLKWFGLKFTHGFNSLVGKYYDGITKPLCVRPGGIWDGAVLETPLNANTVSNSLQSLNSTFGVGNAVFQPIGGGNFQVTNNKGGWWLGGSNTTTVGSDGFHWSFIPVTSALDYATTELAPNIQNENIGTKTSLNPFGVITGITDSYTNGIWQINPNAYLNNRNHLFMRNDVLRDANGAPLMYDSCARIRMLNREIGDNESWLENRVLPWKGAFSIHDRIIVNHRTQFYEYPSFSTPQNIEGVYSKQKPFIILPGVGHADFNINGANLNYTAPFSGTYSAHDVDLVRCCDNVAPPSNKQQNSIASSLNESSHMTVFPNPVVSNQFTICMRALKDVNTSYEILNTLGQMVQKGSIPIQQDNEHIYIPVSLCSDLPNGVYTLRVKNLNFVYRQSLIIKQ